MNQLHLHMYQLSQTHTVQSVGFRQSLINGQWNLHTKHGVMKPKRTHLHKYWCYHSGIFLFLHGKMQKNYKKKGSVDYPPNGSPQLSDSSYHSSNEQHDIVLQGGVWQSEVKSKVTVDKELQKGYLTDNEDSDDSSIRSLSPSYKDTMDSSHSKSLKIQSPMKNEKVPKSSSDSFNINDKLEKLSSKIHEREMISSRTYIKNFPAPQINKTELGPKRKRQQTEKEKQKQKKKKD